jgi:uncharacterized protein YaaQ
MKKMIMAVIPHDHAIHVVDALVDSGFTATFGESRGGMLRQTQRTLFIAVDDEDLEQVLSLIKKHCRTPSKVEAKEKPDRESRVTQSITADLGGAVVFTWDIDQIVTY